jgi:hypothetical protein
MGGFEPAAHKIAALGLPTLLVQEGGYLGSHLSSYLGGFLRGFEPGPR